MLSATLHFAAPVGLCQHQHDTVRQLMAVQEKCFCMNWLVECNVAGGQAPFASDAAAEDLCASEELNVGIDMTKNAVIFQLFRVCGPSPRPCLRLLSVAYWCMAMCIA